MSKTNTDKNKPKRFKQGLRLSVQRLRDVFDTLPIGVFQSSPNGKYLYANPYTASMLGYDSPDELIRSITDISKQVYSNPKDRNEILCLIKEHGYIKDYEVQSLRKNGSTIWCLMSVRAVRNADGEILFFEGTSQDITERKRSEEALVESEELYRTLIETSPDPIIMYDLSGTILTANAETAKVYGVYSIEEFLSEVKMVFDLLTEEGKAFAMANFGKTLTAGKSQKNEYSVRLRNGEIITTEINSSMVRSANGEPFAFLSVIRDITERKRAEKVLGDSELLLNETQKIARLGGWEANPHTDYLKWTEGVYDIIEAPRDYKPSLSEGLKFFSPEYIPIISEKLANCLATGELFSLECQVITATGKRLWTEVKGLSPVLERERSFVLGTFQDITERKEAEEALQESMEKYRLLADNSKDVIWTTNLDGRFTYVSPSVKELSGFTQEETLTIPLDKYLYEEDIPWVMDILYSEMKKPREERMESTLVEVRQYKKDGSLLDIEVSTKWLYNEHGEIIGLQGSTRDISARKNMERESANLEKQLLQAQKMEAIGTLAGGLAHDFNNILTTMQGHISLMKMSMNAAHPHYSRLEKIEDQIMSSANITRQLLGFSKGGKYEIKTINPNEILENSSEVFGRTKKELSITKRFQEDVWVIDADPGQIEQTLFNMYINAWQAMPDGGELYLESKNILLNDMDVIPHGLKPGRYVMLSITDTGIGMDKETIKRIFEPFFTTKEQGKGTGLGLASAYGIIKNHDGFITVYTEKGKGTTFNIYLPASTNQQLDEEKPALTGNDMGNGTILLVDDEAAIVAVTKELLESRGYKVLTAGSGQEAVAVFMEKKDSIDLVILDMIMPGIGGSKTFDDLINIDPDVKVILASGYSINGEAQRILDKGCKGFIQKPYLINELSKKMQQVLNMDGNN